MTSANFPGTPFQVLAVRKGARPGEPLAEELLLDLLDPFLSLEEQDMLLGWHLGARF